MNPFVEHLPWRVAALAGLVVGGVSFAAAVDVWTCLLRVGAAFVLFGLGGLALRSALRQPAPPPGDGRGRHFDQTTPAAPDESGAASPPKSSDVK